MKKKKIAKKAGQPTKKNNINLARVEKLCLAGCTQEQIAIACDVSLSSIINYMKSDVKFLRTIKDNCKLANAMVKRSIWERANGYSHPDVHISNYQGKITVTNIIKHYPPDPVSGIFWLCNRDPENWKRGDKEYHREDLVDEEIELIPSNGKSKEMHSRIARFLN